MAKIGIIGECMVELINQQGSDYHQTFGGDTLNTAVYLKRVAGSDVDVSYVTLLGDDRLSDEMLARWQNEGIDTSCVERIAGQVPGLYMIQTTPDGERSFLYWRDQAPAKQLFATANADALSQQLMDCDWLFLSGITLGIMSPAGRERMFKLFEQFRANGGKVVFDVNHRPRLWPDNDCQDWYERMYRLTDLALPSIEDEEVVWGDGDAQSVIDRLHGFGCAKVVLKRGTDDCFISTAQGLQAYPVIPAEQVLDTTAAGDSYNGGFLAMAVRGMDDAQCMAMGQHISRQVVGKKGAVVDVDVTI